VFFELVFAVEIANTSTKTTANTFLQAFTAKSIILFLLFFENSSYSKVQYNVYTPVQPVQLLSAIG
jgi:hypothetical protein